MFAVHRCLDVNNTGQRDLDVLTRLDVLQTCLQIRLEYFDLFRITLRVLDGDHVFFRRDAQHFDSGRFG